MPALPPPLNDPDAELMTQWRSGDSSALRELMFRHGPKLHSAALNMLRNPADAEEMVQDAFIRAGRALDRFRGDSTVFTWLYRITLNLSRNRYWYYVRRCRNDVVSLQSSTPGNPELALADAIDAVEASPRAELIQAEFSKIVDAAMQKLSEKHRDVLTRRNVLHSSYEEIAAALGVNVGTVKSRIARARQNLLAHMTEACPELRAIPAIDWFEPVRDSGAISRARGRTKRRAS
jgi:RNA polymerase sigma-70 factor, ECF subfamily